MNLLHCFKHVLKRCMPLLMSTLLFPILSANGYALSPYSTRELEELEKEFIQLINQSDSIERNPLANQYINHLGKKLARFAHIPTPYFLSLNPAKLMRLQVLAATLALTHN